ncbi:hypothetical protein KC323_g84 [Hortaea werneckii]|nr:hypothetical protein KC323_g84 [Hortaea werneckii]
MAHSKANIGRSPVPILKKTLRLQSAERMPLHATHEARLSNIIDPVHKHEPQDPARAPTVSWWGARALKEDRSARRAQRIATNSSACSLLLHLPPPPWLCIHAEAWEGKEIVTKHGFESAPVQTQVRIPQQFLLHERTQRPAVVLDARRLLEIGPIVKRIVVQIVNHVL